MSNPLGERVKIVATIGPKSESPAVLRRMLEEGADAIRVNASHADPPAVAPLVKRIRTAARSTGRDVAILLDLQGIKRRIGDLPEPMPLAEGQTVTLGRGRGEGFIPVRRAALGDQIAAGTDIFLNDGFIRLNVKSVRKTGVVCEVIIGGELPSRAGVNLPGQKVRTRIPTPRDLEHMEAGVAAGVDLFALSFVRSADDLWRCRRHAGGIPIIAKIERPEAVSSIDAIAQASDGIMVARGDLAVEMKPEELPVIQKRLIRAANRARKPVIVATEMLKSMVTQSRPTRAELTDVGNAVLDNADATMLSEETAIGRDPARAIRYMARIIATVEGSLLEYDLDLSPPRDDTASRPDWAVADAAVETALNVGAAAIVAITGSGRTARLMSAGRPSVPLFAFAPDATVRRRVALMWGVTAAPLKPIRDPDRLIASVLARLVNAGHLKSGQRVVVAFGSPLWAEGTKTNTIRVAEVD